MFSSFFLSCSSSVTEYKMQGKSMGTTWSVIAQFDKNKDNFFPLSQEETQKDIERELQRINGIMSTYDPNSELSLFNHFQDTVDFEISQELYDVIQKGLNISEQTNGKYDITVGPLLKLWGFGAESSLKQQPPSAEQINETLKKVGYQKLQPKKIAGHWYISKSHPQMYVDLSSIAKGYAVDKIFELLDMAGFPAVMVEIGGEVRTGGKNILKKSDWQIAVEKPYREKRELYQILRLENAAVASSGNYRNYLEMKNHFYGHTIDATNGQAVQDNTNNSLAAVTVLMSNCIQADAWATAFMAMGKTQAIEYAQSHNMDVLFLWMDNVANASSQTAKIKSQTSGKYVSYVKKGTP